MYKRQELYALYETPSTIFRRLQADFGQDALTAMTVKKIREQNRAEILAKRKELSAKIPLLDASERWGYLQSIVDGALEGEIIYDKRTMTPVKAVVERGVALNALKLANDMANNTGVVNTEDDELIRSIVLEAFEDRKGEAPDLTDEEILNEIIESLGDKVKPFVDQVKKELYVSSTEQS